VEAVVVVGVGRRDEAVAAGVVEGLVAQATVRGLCVNWKKVAWRRFFRTAASLPAAKSVVFARDA
jgi:hypothetical protein